MLIVLSIVALTLLSGFLKEFAVSKIKGYAAGKLETIINKISERLIGRKIFEKKDPEKILLEIKEETLAVLHELGIDMKDMENEIIATVNRVLEQIQDIKGDIRGLSQYISSSFYELSKILKVEIVKEFDKLEADLKKSISELSEEEYRKISEELHESFSSLTEYLERKFGEILKEQKIIQKKQDEIIAKLDLILNKLNIPLDLHAEQLERKEFEGKLSDNEREFLSTGIDIRTVQNIKNIETLIMLGNYYLMSGSTSKAIEIFNQIMEMGADPMYQAIALNNIGLIYMNMGDIRKAVNYFKAAVKTNPVYYISYYNLGVLYQRLNNLDEAIKYYQKAIEINPAFWYAYYNLGLIYQTIGNYMMAIQYYQKTVQLAPNFPYAWNNMAMAYAAAGNINQALAILGNLVQKYPNFAMGWYNIGIIYLNMGRLDLAMPYFQRAVAIDPRLREPLKQLGVFI